MTPAVLHPNFWDVPVAPDRPCWVNKRISPKLFGREIIFEEFQPMWSRSRRGQPLLSDAIRQRRVSILGHLCRADIGQDHSRALRACIRGPPKDWRRRTGRPRQTWLRAWERLRTICARSISAWRRHGDYSWIRPRDTLQSRRERESEIRIPKRHGQTDGRSDRQTHDKQSHNGSIAR